MDPLMNIIIVEDHDALREVTVMSLQEMGHTVRGVSCAEALDAELQRCVPHILLLDLNLPGEDGVSIANRVRRMHPEIGIIMVTARKELHDRITGYQSGADIYLTKPTALGEIAVAIEALSRRITTWAGDSLQVALDPGQLKSAERARAVHQQLINTKGKLPTLDELASQYGCSPRILNSEFAVEYGQSVQAFIAHYRFDRAHTALQQTTVPMKVLASQLGYSHVNHFIAAFKKKFGYSPGTLRKPDE